MNVNLAPVLLLSCMGLITTGLITILYQDNRGERDSSHRAILHPPPPTKATLQTRKLPSPAPYNINRSPYAPLGYNPETLDFTHAQSVCQPQKNAEDTRLVAPIVQWERDMYTSIPGTRQEQGQKIRYASPSLFQGTNTSGYMRYQTNPAAAKSRYQREQSRSSSNSYLMDSLNRPLDGAQLYAPTIGPLPYPYTQPSDHTYEYRQQPYIAPRNISPERDRRDSMWGQPGAYPSYSPSDRVISYP
jgi:hypothetical protein